MNGRRYGLIFLIASIGIGISYWWQADWWAYVEFPDRRSPKFELPWWVQLPISSIVGCVGGGCAVAVACFVAWAYRRRARHDS